MRGFPGVSKFRVRYRMTRGPYKGWLVSYVYFKARIMRNGRARFLGHFSTPQQAAAAYREAKDRLKTADGRSRRKNAPAPSAGP